MSKRILTISVTETGAIHVEGPLHDPIQCFGLLEVAKDLIREHVTRQAEAKRIVAPVIADVTKMNGAAPK